MTFLLNLECASEENLIVSITSHVLVAGPFQSKWKRDFPEAEPIEKWKMRIKITQQSKDCQTSRPSAIVQLDWWTQVQILI